MSKRPSLYVDIYSDEDDDDDDLLKDTSLFLRKKSPPAAASLVPPPKSEEYHSPLGTADFTSMFRDASTIGQDVKLSLEERGSSKYVSMKDTAGNHIPVSMPSAVTSKLVRVLDQHGAKIHCQATHTSMDSLKITFLAKANRMLSEFEKAPLLRDLQKYLGSSFTKIRKLTPVKSEPSVNSASSSSSSSSVPLPTPLAVTMAAAGATNNNVVSGDNTASSAAAVTAGAPADITNIRTTSDGRAYTVEQENNVRFILENEQKGYYAMLGLTNTANLAALKSAYRSMARSVHPDKNRAPDAKKAFQLVGNAYSVLSNPEQRAAYDQEFHRPAATTASSSSFSGTGTAYTPDFDVYELFRTFFAEDDVETVHVDIEEPDWENQHEELEKMFDEQVGSQLSELPKYKMPPELAHVKLFDYQVAGIRWLVHQELNQGIPSWFTEEGYRTWRDKITSSVWHQRPSPVRGGILADDMGLGKTMQAIGLILSNPPAGQKGYPYIPARSKGTNRNRCTLIICPLSVIANWTLQIRRHVNMGGRKEILKVGVYHGPNRKNMIPLIQHNQVDIVLTSYQTLAYDYRQYIDESDKKKPKKAKCYENEIFIFDLCLHRIILDEAHIIRNSKTGVFKAVKQLTSIYKLALTGTPFVNRPEDLRSLLSFLNALPLANPTVFKKFVTDKIKERKQVGMEVLRVALAHVSLRRRKDMVKETVKLVPFTINVEAIEFEDGPHKNIHDALYQSARAVLERYFLKGDDEVLDNYMFFISLILRVRQSCCHSSLVPQEATERALQVLNIVQEKAARDIEIDFEEAEELLERLRGGFVGMEQLEECAICLEAIGQESARILRTCKHIFCAPCLNQVPQPCCPLCRAAFTPDDIVSKAAAEKSTKSEKKVAKVKVKHDGLGQSPKLVKLFALIEEMKPDEKGVIFSQWTSLLDIVQREMERLGHTFTRIDGSMNAQERIDAMEKFDTEKCNSQRTPRFVLCSLHACGVGINLERGSVAFMLDPWWNASAESQASARIHRISSKKPVRVYRLVMDQTLEQRMLGLQDAKEMLGKGTMQRLSPEESRKARLTQLRDLFQIPDSLEQDWTSY